MTPIKLNQLPTYSLTIEEDELRLTEARLNFFIPDNLIVWSVHSYVRQEVESRYDYQLSQQSKTL